MKHSVTHRAKITLQGNEHIYVWRKDADSVGNATWYCLYLVLFILYTDQNACKESGMCIYK